MADILIKGIEMPTKGYRLILIHADGTVQTTDGETTAISVPPHGRLIDADALEYGEAYLNGHYELGDFEIVTREDIESAPTIIPASEEKTG